MVKGQIESQYGQMTRQKVKRELLDALDIAYQFEAPSKLVEPSSPTSGTRSTATRDRWRTFADENTTEEKAKAEYRGISERRVRLGLVLAEIGEKAGVQVSDDEFQRSLFDSVRRFPADQQQQVFDFYRNNPNALANLRAPLFEEKVVDHLLTSVDVTDKKVSKEELSAEDSDETPAKPAKKAASKKAEKKADEASEATAEEPKKKPAPKKKAAAKDDAE